MVPRSLQTRHAPSFKPEWFTDAKSPAIKNSKDEIRLKLMSKELGQMESKSMPYKLTVSSSITLAQLTEKIIKKCKKQEPDLQEVWYDDEESGKECLLVDDEDLKEALKTRISVMWKLVNATEQGTVSNLIRSDDSPLDKIGENWESAIFSHHWRCHQDHEAEEHTGFIRSGNSLHSVLSVESCTDTFTHFLGCSVSQPR
ncbi:hypothetical protein BC830DRAFT_830593 [Chytriomyces sp. MP71]|nr:hypothetical protein BC830DRAFT_830593 [Chytriomyces sp. MP71]